MDSLPGVYEAQKKNGEIYYRSSITYKHKHISLGSYSSAVEANKAYNEALLILSNKEILIEDHINKTLPFIKWVVLINFRDNNIYIKNPIYLKSKYFIYYLTPSIILKFDVDDLFYYSNHKILKRGGHLFVCEFGMQTNILSRYGIKNWGVAGRDYRFVNGDTTDYRYGNIEIVNRYNGVMRTMSKGFPYYTSKIHVNGNIIIGRYLSENEAAIAYNKAAAILNSLGVNKNFPSNYIEDIDAIEYAKIYNKVRISNKIINFHI